jgi:hypothetical protein
MPPWPAIVRPIAFPQVQTLSTEYREQDRHQQGNHHTGHDRKVKAESVTHDVDVARQTAEWKF